uniref:F-box protein At3g56470-like n=1 Tax=Erigeron canadensis TaxID=72917 RepID=UPI001CB9AF4D|nr:F-box protein At3g56470-like [Erigeron canadensis]
MSGDKYFLKTPEELIDYQICYCRFGWLLMHRIDGPMVFYNPFTNEVRELPRPELRLDSYCFSAPPTSLDCYVLGFLKSGRYDVYIHPAGWYWKEEKYWSELFRENLHANPHYFRFPTFHDGDYYALSDAGGIHVLNNLVSHDPSWEVLIAEAPESGSTSTPVKRFLEEM